MGKFGKCDPYFGVISDERYKNSKLTAQKKEDFFASGYNYVNIVISNVKKHLDPNFAIKNVLDFGCGV